MLIKEYRIPVPVSRDEYQIAQLFAVAESSKNETGNGEGVEVLVNQRFEDENGKGQFTHKVYHLSSKVPAYIRVLAPNGALEVHEKAWNAFPYCKTVMTNAYMKDNFHLVIESRHSDGEAGAIDNIHNLDKKQLEKRDIVMIDIADNKAIESKDYKPEEDPSLYHSARTGRGPLQEGWQPAAKPVMTCYKLVTVEFKWFGLQGKIENFIQHIIQGVFTKFHRQLFCWLDRWYGMTLDEIRQIEEKTKRELDEKRGKHPVDTPNLLQDQRLHHAATK